MTEREIVVIGGGIIGVCSAYYLVSALTATPEASLVHVTLVEEEGIACAASGKAGGFLAMDWHGPATTSLARLSYTLHQQLATEHDGAERWGYRAMESLSFAIKASSGNSTTPPADNYALEDSHLHMTEPNGEGEVEVDWLSPNGETNMLGTTETTSQVHPRLFTEAIFASAVQRGLRYIRGYPAKLNSSSTTSSLESLEVLVEGTMQTLPCTDIILTAGPWTAQVASTLGISPVPPITNMPGHSVLVRPPRGSTLSATAVFASIYGANPRYASGAINARMTESPELFPRPDGVIFIGGENEAQEMPAHPGEVDALVDDDIAERLIRAAKIVAKDLGEGVVEARQLCYRPTTPDRRPIVGKLKDHIWVAAGHGPWGITLGPGTGKIIAELVLNGEAKSADIGNLDPARFN